MQRTTRAPEFNDEGFGKIFVGVYFYSKSQYDTSSLLVGMNCNICLECLLGANAEEVIVQCREGHNYHGKCLETWFVGANDKQFGRCPTCRKLMSVALPQTNRTIMRINQLIGAICLEFACCDVVRASLHCNSTHTTVFASRMERHCSSRKNDAHCHGGSKNA